jgi:hypothetical protein
MSEESEMQSIDPLTARLIHLLINSFSFSIIEISRKLQEMEK